MSMDKKQIAELVYIFMLAAEQYVQGTKRGAERKEWVMARFYSALPSAITNTIPRSMLDGMIESCMSKLKEKLAEAAE